MKKRKAWILASNFDFQMVQFRRGHYVIARRISHGIRSEIVSRALAFLASVIETLPPSIRRRRDAEEAGRTIIAEDSTRRPRGV
jgi:hypothetical protein